MTLVRALLSPLCPLMIPDATVSQYPSVPNTTVSLNPQRHGIPQLFIQLLRDVRCIQFDILMIIRCVCYPPGVGRLLASQNCG